MNSSDGAGMSVLSIQSTGFCSPPQSRRKVLDDTCDLSMDWIEEQMAKVCGEEGENTPENIPNCSPTKPLVPRRLRWTLAAPQGKEEKTITDAAKPEHKNLVANQLSNPSSNITNWKLVRIKHEAELERKLKRAEQTGGVEKRARLETRFVELFGPRDTSADSSIGQRKERDEVAAFTVQHLMPLYKQQKIASKELFKKLAKHITNSVLEKCQSPDENSVRERVSAYFRDGKSVDSEGDIYCL